ncbi:MAG: helix-turn-helix domain-containing protein [Minisyncoccota bacterium]
MEKEKSLQTIFEETLEQKNLSHDKLAAITSIPRRYIIAIQNLELNMLPSSPYVRGYLKKICEVLGLDFNNIWKIYEKELKHKTSGAFDKLPINRFAIQKINKKSVASAVIAVVLIIFAISNFNNFFAKPYLNIENPKEAITTTSEPSIDLIGTIDPKDKLTINDREIITDSYGNFESIYELQNGLNTINLKVKKIFGKENLEIRQVMLEATTTPEEFIY